MISLGITVASSAAVEPEGPQLDEVKAPMIQKLSSNEKQGAEIKLDIVKDNISLDHSDDEENVDTNQSITNTAKQSEEKQIASLKKQSMYPISLMLLSSLSFSAMSFLVKLSGSSIPAFEIVFIRSIVQGILGFAFIPIMGVGFHNIKNNIKPLIFRGLTGFFGLSCYYFGLTALPLGEAVVISFISPVFVALLGVFILKEPWEKMDMFGAFLSMAGVVFIAEPEFIFGSQEQQTDEYAVTGWVRTLAVFIILSGSFSGALSSVLIRKMGSTLHSLHIVNAFSVASFLLVPIPWLIFQKVVIPSLTEWLALIAVGVCAFIGQVTFNKALQLEKAAKATTISYIQIVFALLWEFIFFHHHPDLWGALGVGLICSWALVTALKTWTHISLMPKKSFFVRLKQYASKAVPHAHLLKEEKIVDEAHHEDGSPESTNQIELNFLKTDHTTPRVVVS